MSLSKWVGIGAGWYFGGPIGAIIGYYIGKNFFSGKNDNEKALNGDQVIFDYSATVNGNKFEGSEGKGVQIELGKNLFLKGFDEQLAGASKGETKIVDDTPGNRELIDGENFTLLEENKIIMIMIEYVIKIN